jgi:hypothetical protein
MTDSHPPSRPGPFGVFARLAVALACAAAGVAQAAVDARPVVAEATLVIGTARLAGSDGSSRAVERGAAVRIGDRIETDLGGHVHLRFVDGARVSVRPGSRLAVEDYRRGEGEQRGAIRFKLEEGVMRSITGEWGEAAREQFRLNTPLAAIGIKGTDFVARADAERSLVSVFSGAVVMAPLDSQCAATVGPCLNGLEALLTQEQRGQVLQVASGQGQPGAAGMAEAGESPGRPTLAGVAGRARALAADDAAPLALPDNAEATLAELRRAVEARPDTSAPLPPPRVEQLAWGRWSWARPIAGDTLAQEIDTAFRQGREGLVSNGAFSLFRTTSALPSDLPLRDGQASFRLAGGSAYVLRTGSFTEPASATVQSGSLAIDFDRGTFSTQLLVTGPTIGQVGLDATGSVLANGVFLSTAGNGTVAGGLSRDGREAGYLFERSLDAGQLRGITLWGP